MDPRRSRVAILGTRFDDFGVEREILGDVELVSGPGRTADEVLEVAATADVILAGAAPRFGPEVLEQLECRGIVRLGVGVDSIDLPAAERVGLWVAYVPAYGTEAVALHTVALVLAAVRRIPIADRRVRDGGWGLDGLRPLHLPAALTVGIVGLGRIGRRVGDMLAGLGFERFLIHDPWVDATLPLPGSLVSLEDLLGGADVVTLHAPAPSDGHLIGRPQLAAMRDGAVLVNTARGRLIDTGALIESLTAGRPAVAALDVFEEEPVDVSVFEPVLDRVILTPHMSWYSEETELELRRQGALAARRILDGLAPAHPVVTPGEVDVK